MNLIAFRATRLFPNLRDSAHRVPLAMRSARVAVLLDSSGRDRRRFIVIGITISMLSSCGSVQITKVYLAVDGSP